MAAALLVFYVAAAAAVVLWPSPVDGGLKSQLKGAIAALQDGGAPQFVTYGFVESAANVVFFVPLGVLVTLMAVRRFWWAAPLVGVLLSTAAEVAQLLFLPHRFATLADVAANTSGAIVGTLAVLAVRGTLGAVARLGVQHLGARRVGVQRLSAPSALLAAPAVALADVSPRRRPA